MGEDIEGVREELLDDPYLEDAQTWSVYADWLEDSGSHLAAEDIRWMVDVMGDSRGDTIDRLCKFVALQCSLGRSKDEGHKRFIREVLTPLKDQIDDAVWDNFRTFTPDLFRDPLVEAEINRAGIHISSLEMVDENLDYEGPGKAGEFRFWDIDFSFTLQMHSGIEDIYWRSHIVVQGSMEVDIEGDVVCRVRSAETVSDFDRDERDVGE